MTGNAVLASHEYIFNDSVEAAVLYAKHYWATAPPARATEVVLDDAKGIPVASPGSKVASSGSKSFWRRLPAAAVVGMFWGASELIITLTRRSRSNAITQDRHSLGLMWLVNLTAVVFGILAAYRLPFCRMPAPGFVLKLAVGVFGLGLALRWYAVFYLGRFFTANVAVASDHRVIDSGPYRFVRHPGYAGSLLAVFGLGMSFQNWASLLIIFASGCAVTLWRIHIEEQAVTKALGQEYSDYTGRTGRLIPGIY